MTEQAQARNTMVGKDPYAIPWKNTTSPNASCIKATRCGAFLTA